jgi:hypothetical protein
MSAIYAAVPNVCFQPGSLMVAQPARLHERTSGSGPEADLRRSRSTGEIGPLQKLSGQADIMATLGYRPQLAPEEQS